MYYQNMREEKRNKQNQVYTIIVMHMGSNSNYHERKAWREQELPKIQWISEKRRDIYRYFYSYLW